jgi:hypothetical protein
MIFKEFFEKQFCKDFGLLPRIIGITSREDDDGVWFEEDVEDPYITTDTGLCVLLDSFYAEPDERRSGEYRLTKPHESYSFEERYKFIVHQLKYLVIDMWLHDGVEKASDAHYDILYLPGQMSPEVFVGIDKQTNRSIEISEGHLEGSFPLMMMDTHVEDGCMGMWHGIIAIPRGEMSGTLVFTNIERDYGTISVRLIKLCDSNSKLDRVDGSITMNMHHKHISPNIDSSFKTPWEEQIHSRYDLYHNPTNRGIWHLLAKPSELYDGKNIFISKYSNIEFIYARAENEWIPIDKEWLLVHPTEIFRQAADELQIIANVTNLAGNASLQ